MFNTYIQDVSWFQTLYGMLLEISSIRRSAGISSENVKRVARKHKTRTAFNNQNPVRQHLVKTEPRNATYKKLYLYY